MPDTLVLVYEKATGTPAYMHTVDAKEAVGLGQYTYTAPEGQEADDAAKAQAMAVARGVPAPLPPEMSPAVPEIETPTPAPPVEASSPASGGVSTRTGSRSRHTTDDAGGL
jgi:hypothetical protein